MEDLTRLELRLLIVGLIGLVDDLGTVAGEETVLACVRALARGVQTHANAAHHGARITVNVATRKRR